MGKSWMNELQLLLAVALWLCDLEAPAEAQSVLCYEAFDEATGSCHGLLGEGVTQGDCCLNQEYSFRTAQNAPCRSCRRAEWTAWSSWSVCSVSCTEGVQRRKRTCYGQGGNGCEEGSRQWEMQSCRLRDCCPVVGGWSEWGAWSPCSVTCARGSQTRERLCNNPVPACGGSCVGIKTEKRECDTQQICPTHGNWGSWGNWEACPATCMPEGSAPKPRQKRQRQCNSPQPSVKPPGNPCQGEGQEFRTCTGLPPCPQDGNWGSWKAASPCSVTCGVGRSTEKRLCDNPAPKHGGKGCSGSDTRIHICNTRVPCPVDGQWTEWSSWSTCERRGTTIKIACTEIPGLQKRTRSCFRAHDGKRCSGGSSIETRSCYSVQFCPLTGSWSEWSPWGLCEPPCGENPQRSRKRECKPNYPDYPPTIEGENGKLLDVYFWGTAIPKCQPLQGQLKEVVERTPCHNVPPCEE